MEIRNVSTIRATGGDGQGASTRQLYPAGDAAQSLLAVDLLEVETGGQVKLHSYGEEHILFVIAGSGELSAADGGAVALVRADSVVYIAPHEACALKNTGEEQLRVLVSTPLLVRSARALGIEPAPAQKAQEKVIPPPRGASHAAPVPAPPVEAESTSEANVVREERRTPGRDAPADDASADAPDDSASPIDISTLMKRASELPKTPRAEKRMPAPAAEAEPEVEASDAEDETEDNQRELMELNVVFDGGSRGNPGQGYGSYLVQSPGRRPVVKRVEFGDNYTNNQAEYEALISCLQYIIERLTVTNRSPGQVVLDIKSDSDLVVNQLLGTFKVKDSGLKKRHDQAMSLLGQFGEWMLAWHPREESVRLLGH
ncbi:MAG: reverse transcriptase-like protein [Chloroflexi bacterium]|nr:reverse transcriptase-like protein [Chloroflexota bacterium]